MLQIHYDGSMAGLLSAIFEAYERKAQDTAMIVKNVAATPDAFARRIDVPTDALKARRVWAGLARKLSREALDQLYYCYLSELPDMETLLLDYVRYVFSQPGNIEENFGHPAVLRVAQTAKKTGREKHRMEAFVRFQELGDGLFYAMIEPDFNVLPLIVRHFKRRYADQDWLIYDGRRKYGLYYSKATETVQEVHPEWKEGSESGRPGKDVLSPDEALYQQLWKDYFKSTGIPARNNPRLHLRHVPLRYWRHLTEKRL